MPQPRGASTGRITASKPLETTTTRSPRRSRRPHELGEPAAAPARRRRPGDDLVVVAADRLELAADALVERDLARAGAPLDLVVDAGAAGGTAVEGVLLGDRAVEVDDDEQRGHRPVSRPTWRGWASCPTAIIWNSGFGLFSVLIVSIRPTEIPCRWQKSSSDWRSELQHAPHLLLAVPVEIRVDADLPGEGPADRLVVLLAVVVSSAMRSVESLLFVRMRTRTYGAQSMVAPLREVLVHRPGEAFGRAFDDPAHGYLHEVDLGGGPAGARRAVHAADRPRAPTCTSSATRASPDLTYTFDPVLVTDNGVVPSTPGKPNRQSARSG